MSRACIKVQSRKTLLLLILSLSSLAHLVAQESAEIVDTVTASNSNVHFDSITYEQSYKPKELEGSVVAQLKKQDDFWYADESPERQLPKTTSSPTTIRKPFFTQRWFATLVWILIIASFITVIIWFLAVSDVRVFRKAPARINPDFEETLPDDIFSIAFEKELKDSIATKNLRMATRLMYLHILKLLTEKNIIDYKAGRTNSDYLQQALDTSYYADLLRLTRSFEYVWYGKFDLQEPVFSLVQKNYETLKFSLT